MAKMLGRREGVFGFLGIIGARFMMDGSESGGRFSVVEHPMSPRVLAAPLHRHSREDEYSCVVRGRLGALLGDDVIFAVSVIPCSSHATSGIHSGTHVIKPPASSKSSRLQASSISFVNYPRWAASLQFRLPASSSSMRGTA